MERVTVILAGGEGVRFWPVSRKNKPKQFLSLNGKEVMINETISRNKKITSHDNTYILIRNSLAGIMKSVLKEKIPENNILKVPTARNTATCTLYAAMHIMKTKGDAVMMVLPADHYIEEIDKYEEIMNKACLIAGETNSIVSIGVPAIYPSIAYGYSKAGENKKGTLDFDFFGVDEYVEKPSLEVASGFVASGDYFWNAGIFVWKISKILDCFKTYLPEMYNSVLSMYDSIGTQQEQECVDKIYLELQDISTEHAIIEKSKDVVVIPAQFKWSDIGSWDSLRTICEPEANGNIIQANHVGIETRNCIVYGDKRMVATVGVENLIVVETEDAILICDKNKAQDVKKLVEEIAKKGYKNYL